jgi:hypothetical protein
MASYPPISARVNQPLRLPRRSAVRQPGQSGPAWPSYTGTAQLIGTSSSGVSVYVDPSLGQPALQNAQDLLAAADAVVQQNDTIFDITGAPVDVIVFALGGKTDGTGGADHDGCDVTTGSAIAQRMRDERPALWPEHGRGAVTLVCRDRQQQRARRLRHRTAVGPGRYA